MLKCNCGWFGVNLIPVYEINRSARPECGLIFQGIPADNAIYEPDLVKEKEILERLRKERIHD